VIAQANKTLDDAYCEELPAQDLIDRNVTDLLALTPLDADSMVPVAAAAVEYVTSLESDVVQRWETGLVDLDALTGGLRAGRMTVIAGRPGSGKTSLGLSIAVHVARQSVPVAFFTREMDRQSLAARVLSWGARVSTERLDRKEATDAQWAAVARTMTGLEGVPLRFEEAGETLTQITAWCKRLLPDGLRCAVVDYLQLLVSERRQENRTQEVAYVSRGLARLAQDLRIAVVALSQVSRAPDARKDKRPHLADLRESGSIEQDADVVVLLHRPEMYKQTDENHGIAEAIVAKQRSGPTGVVKLAFIKEYAMFGNLESSHYVDEGA
jgi:replicative DNA helicase